MVNTAPKLMQETVFERTDSDGIDVTLWACRVRSDASRETSYSGMLTVGGKIVIEQTGVVLADGSAETTTVFYGQNGTREALRLTMEPQEGGGRLYGDLNGKPISALNVPAEAFSDLSWTAIKTLPSDRLELVFDDGQPVVLSEIDSTSYAGANALVATIDANDSNKLNRCALAVMAGAMGVAIATGGAGAGIIIAGQLFGSAYCAIP